jgi:SIR2-like domain
MADTAVQDEQTHSIIGATHPGGTGGRDVELPYRVIAKLLSRGKVVPFLGAGASVFHRPRDGTADPLFCPPTGAALAERLAELAAFPSGAAVHHRQNLALVASYLALVTAGEIFLRDELREVFSPQFEPNALHHLLASVAKEKPQLVVTTNYDDMIERAFDRAGVPYHLVVTNMGNIEKAAGSLLHRTPGGKAFVLVNPRKLEVSLEEASIIYKMHGSINRISREEDSYVITEEHYLRFLGGFSSKVVLVPPDLAAMMKTRHFLFLGYSLRDWNLRVMLDMLGQFESNASKLRSWAVQYDPDAIEGEIWERKSLDIVRLDLQQFVDDLAKVLRAPVTPS